MRTWRDHTVKDPEWRSWDKEEDNQEGFFRTSKNAKWRYSSTKILLHRADSLETLILASSPPIPFAEHALTADPEADFDQLKSSFVPRDPSWDSNENIVFAP
jgi:hypothetical protein